jgi:hypothetical protein
MSQCPLLALSGHSASTRQCPLLGVKRTSHLTGAMSAFDPKQTLSDWLGLKVWMPRWKLRLD